MDQRLEGRRNWVFGAILGLAQGEGAFWGVGRKGLFVDGGFELAMVGRPEGGLDG